MFTVDWRLSNRTSFSFAFFSEALRYWRNSEYPPSSSPSLNVTAVIVGAVAVVALFSLLALMRYWVLG